MTERETMELVYGLLWTVPLDTNTTKDRLIRNARLALADVLTHDGRAAGIARAQAALETMEPTRRSG